MGEWRSPAAWRRAQPPPEGPRSRSWSGKPPHPPGPWNSAVPSWERRFCTSVCRIPWRKLCETKEVMGMYKNVVQWDDSAALEAFQNAKARFWAEINGLPCDIPLPESDLYIDEIDYDAIVDPALLADLEKQPPPPVDVYSSTNNGWDSVDEPIEATGWGSPENPTAEHWSANWDAYIERPIVPTGWGDAEDPVSVNNPPAKPDFSTWDNKPQDNSFNALNTGAWEINGDSARAWKCSAGWGDGILQVDPWVSGRDNSWNTGWDNSWDNRQDNSRNNGRDNSWSHQDNRNNEPDRRYGRKRGGGGLSGSGYTKSRHRTDDYRPSNTWRNRGRNRATYEQVV